MTSGWSMRLYGCRAVSSLSVVSAPFNLWIMDDPGEPQPRSVRTRQRIFRAAAEEILVNGYAGTSLAGIAGNLGLTKGGTRAPCAGQNRAHRRIHPPPRGSLGAMRCPCTGSVPRESFQGLRRFFDQRRVLRLGRCVLRGRDRDGVRPIGAHGLIGWLRARVDRCTF